MQAQAERFGARTELAEIYSAKLAGNVKTVQTSEGEFSGRTLVIATGAEPRKLGVPGENGRNVHYCAACDGMAYKGKTVLVVGGGNSAAADALTLSRIAKKVYIVHRRDTLRATKIYHEPLEKAENVEFLWNSAVTQISPEGVTVENLQTGQKSLVQTDGVFISIGRAPATNLVAGELALENGYIPADESTKTTLPGVFAVGDVRTKEVRQIVTAVADGATAAHYAEKHLTQKRV